MNPKHIMEGIKALENRKDVIIHPADKGGGVVVMDKTYYHSQLLDMLQDENTYQQLDKDPTNKYREDLFNLVDYGFYKRVITKKEKIYLCPSFNRIPTIYTVPKIHKNPERPPARPIVNGINSVTSRVGEYLDHFLQTSVDTTKPYLKDTTSFIQKIKNVSFSKNAEMYLVTADVASLYTIIQHDDALLALNWAFMSAKFTLSLANLFMSEWEDKWIYHKRRKELVFYQRYIDDLFMI